MARLTIAGREFDIAPFKLGALKRAAPTIDRINERLGVFSMANASMEQLLDNADDLVQVLGIGLAKIDPECTAEWLGEAAGFQDIPALAKAYTELMAESGFSHGGGEAPGEAPAPAAEEAAGASQSE